MFAVLQWRTSLHQQPLLILKGILFPSVMPASPLYVCPRHQKWSDFRFRVEILYGSENRIFIQLKLLKHWSILYWIFWYCFYFYFFMFSFWHSIPIDSVSIWSRRRTFAAGDKRSVSSRLLPFDKDLLFGWLAVWWDCARLLGFGGRKKSKHILKFRKCYKF